MRPAAPIRPPCPIWLLALALLALAMTGQRAHARSADALALSDTTQRSAVWPWVSVATDRSRSWTLGDALSQPQAFTRPAVPDGNLGPQRAVHWLKLRLLVDTTETKTWWLSIDYPLLDRAEVHLLREGRLVARHLTGNHLPFAQRPAPTRVHAVSLELDPRSNYELLLRVETMGPAIVPMSLMSTPELMRSESRVQLWQGLAGGFGLCLMAYAVARALTSRDPMFLWFAVAACAGTLFFFIYHGMAAQHLWRNDAWLNRHAALLSMFGILVGGFLFTEHTLTMPRLSPVIGRLMRAGAAVSMLGASSLALGWLDYQAATRLLMVLGPLPTLLGLPVAARHAWGGDRAARWFFLGFLLYTAGVATMTALNAGLVSATPWNLHAFQIGSLLLLCCWIMVMSVRAEEIEHAAKCARVEQDRLTLVARTDALTGLLNRRGLHAALEIRLNERPSRKIASVCLIDLDGFKPVNDRFGHDAGDELLREIALRLSALAGENALVARLGGDEFVVVSPWFVDETHAAAWTERLQTATASPFMLASGPCHVGMTLGGATAPLHGSDATTLLKHADAAMYAGKQSGRGRNQAFAPPPVTGVTDADQRIASRNA